MLDDPDTAKKEETDPVRAEQLAGAAAYLNLLGVADPAATNLAAGFATPTSVRFAARSGIVYDLQLGGEKTEAPAGRYVRVHTSFTKPAPPADTNLLAAAEAAALSAERDAAAERRRLDGWTFILSPADAEKLAPVRTQLLRTAVTNAAPETVSAPTAPGAPEEPSPATNAPPRKSWLRRLPGK